MKIAKSVRYGLLLALLSLGMADAFGADDTKGILRGTATDAQGNPLGNATVTVVDEERGTTREMVTGADGVYQIPALNTGSYTVTVSKDGKVVSTRKGVDVGIGSKTLVDINLAQPTMEEVLVEGQQRAIDTSSAVKDFVVNVTEFTGRVPVGRDLTSVALLAPTAVRADRTFSIDDHDVPALSLGGASIAENACFINGLNVTNFRNGLGCSQLPFEMYDTIQIKNGGYNAEFGRSIGGVMNATVKSGTNEFQSGINAYYAPESLQGKYKDDYNGNLGRFREDGETNINIWASGPIVKDKLFFYALYSPSSREEQRMKGGGSQINKSEWDDDFWGAKLDWLITDNHTLEYFGFDDTRNEVEDAYDSGTGSLIGTTTYHRGGENHLVKYTGVMTDWMTLSAQYGINKYNRSDIGSTDGNPVIIDQRSGSVVYIGNWANDQPSLKDDERKAWRIDADFYVGDHNIRVGYDDETNTANESTQYSGGVYYRYYTVAAGSTYDGVITNNGITIMSGDEYVRVRNYQNDGSFETVTSAWYVQDEWQMNEQFTLHMGLRNETFDNKNAAGKSFIKIDNQWAPRLGISYDPTATGSSRVYANYGRYFLPIAANTNIRMAGAENFTADWYLLNGLNADDTPIYNTATQFDNVVYADGTVPSTASILNKDIEPMYQDEYIVGYEFDAFENWRFGVKYTYRDLKSTIEDVAVDAALNQYVLATTGVPNFAGGFDYYVLTNPGEDIKFAVDIDGDGIDDPITLSAASLRYPKATRTYKALEFSFDRAFDGSWMMGGSLVLSKLYGNHEGYVKSDNAQDDAGITTSFDQPGLTDGATGNLPNDRPWVLKTWGSYQFENGLVLGSNFTAQDGRPINCIGVHPTDVFAQAYGAESFYCGGQLRKRGSQGRTPVTWAIDVSAHYTFDFGDMGQLVLRGDIFNLFDNDKVVEVWELGEDGGGSPDPRYKQPTEYQLPRTVRFSLNYQF